MTKQFLEEIENTNKELIRITKRLEQIENKQKEIRIDSVQGSSTSYPYIKHSMVIEGNLQNNTKLKNLRQRYKKMLRQKQYKCQKLLLQFEYELNNVRDAEIRSILTDKYIDGMSWIDIMFKYEYNSEDVPRKKIERFFKKNEKNLKVSGNVRSKCVTMLVSKKVIVHIHGLAHNYYSIAWRS